MSLHPFKLTSIKFSLFSPTNIRNISELDVINPDTYDEDGVPIPGGVMDPRFGSQEPYQLCPVCSNTTAFCPGHFGHIELAEPVLHTVFINEIRNILQSLCKLCGRISFPLDELESTFAKITELKKLRQEKLDNFVKEISKISRKMKDCEYCKVPIEKIELQKPYYFYSIDENSRATRIYPSEIRELFERLPAEDLPLIGFDENEARPEWLIMTVLPVPPLSVRPSTQLEAGMRSEDDLTHKLVDIVKVNQKVKESKDAGSPTIIVRDTVDLLQYHVSTYFDNTLAGIPPARHRSGRQLRTIAQRLSGKDGRFRSNLVGKRVDFSARTVISPDSNLEIGEVGVPLEIAIRLTIPERVTELNKEKLQKLVENGPQIHPGVNYIIRPDGRRIYLEYVTDRTIIAQTIESGFIIERHLQDGDLVLFNRQPSLHKMSIMAHKVRVLPHRTFRLHLAVCTPYNADFDGDEMNLHVLQNEEARAEAKILMNVNKQIISPRYGAPIIGLRRDSLTSSYLLTSDDTKLNKREFFNLVAAINHQGKTPKPEVEKPEPLYSGKQAFSLLLPKDFTYSLKSTARNEPVVIKEGKLISGVIDKASIGAEEADSVLHRIAREYGSERAGVFLTKLTMMLDRYLSSRGFSVGSEHLVLNKSAYKKIDKLMVNAKSDVLKSIDLADQNKLEAIKGMTMTESLELNIMDTLSKARDQAGKIALETLDDDNPFATMAISGARGSELNVAQLSAVLGQQAIRGDRIKKGYGDRTLSHFLPGDIGSSAKGFVFSSFLKGLSPTEFFFHAMAGREGLVDTAVRTQESGYLQRRLINSLEHLIVFNDFTVKTYDGKIVQFEYGEDGVDPGRSDHGKPVNVERLVDSISLLYPDKKPAKKDLIIKKIDKIREEIPRTLSETLEKHLTEKETNAKVIDHVVKDAVINYRTSKVDPGTAVGIITAQSMGEPGTQMTLRTFHYAGVKERDVTLGLPRIIEIIDARKNPSTPSMEIYLKKEDRNNQSIAEKLANKVVGASLKEISLGSYIDLAKGRIMFKLDTVLLKRKLVLDEEITSVSMFKKYKPEIIDNTLILLTSEKTIEALQKIMDKLLAKQVTGISGISQITVNYTGSEWVLYTKGSNLRDVLKLNVDISRTSTNDIHQIEEVLGIEAARSAIIKELQGVLDEQGLDVDIRHLMLISDLMTQTGIIKQAGRYGVVAEKQSVLSRAAFEITVPVLRRAAILGEKDNLRGVTENLIVGTRAPIGTGLVDVFMTADK